MAPSLTLPALLPPLPDTEREAIKDALLRATLGIDTRDAKLFDSAFTDDATFEVDGQAMSGQQTIRANTFDAVAKLDITHFITNQRVAKGEGGSTASMTASVLAQHYRHGTGTRGNAPHLLQASLAGLDLEKDASGLWKIKYWKMKVVWRDGDASVFTDD